MQCLRNNSVYLVLHRFRLTIAFRTEHSALRKLSVTQLLPYLVKRMLGRTREDTEYFDYNEIKPQAFSF